jgi:hypothetical protein
MDELAAARQRRGMYPDAYHRYNCYVLVHDGETFMHEAWWGQAETKCGLPQDGHWATSEEINDRATFCRACFQLRPRLRPT